MRSLKRWGVWSALATLLVALGGTPLCAATTPTDNAQVAIAAFAKANAAVVGLRVTVAAEAASAETLGKERTGSGVVIGADGLILTIGYLMMDLDQDVSKEVCNQISTLDSNIKTRILY